MMHHPLVDIYRQDYPNEQVFDGGDTLRAGHCPFCGHRADGTQGDRFRFFKAADAQGRFRWLCNACGECGDMLDYLRRVRGMSFAEATQNVASLSLPIREEREAGTLSGVISPDLWQSAAQAFVARSQAALSCPQAQAFYQGERFLTLETVRACGFGWNPQTVYPLRRAWGMSEAKPEQKHCLPAGAVLPLWQGGKIASVEVRCVPAHTFQGKSFTHWHLKYEAANLVLHGRGRAVVLFESILDAALAWQASNRELSVIAVTGASKSFDAQAVEVIESASVLIGCPDADEGGVKAARRWRGAFPQIRLKPAFGGKDLCDAHRQALQGKEAFTAEQWVQLRVRPLVEAEETERTDTGQDARAERCRDCPQWVRASMFSGRCKVKHVETSDIAKCESVAGFSR